MPTQSHLHMTQYVSFEVAELISSKLNYNYRNSVESKAYHKDDPETLIDAIKGNVVRGYYLAPPMQEVVDLLRDKHEIYVSVALYNYGMNGDIPSYYPIIKSISRKTMGRTLEQGFRMKPDFYDAMDDGLIAILKKMPLPEPVEVKERHQQVDIAGQLDPLYKDFSDNAVRFGNECKITAKGKVLVAPDPRRLFELYKEAMK